MKALVVGQSKYSITAVTNKFDPTKDENEFTEIYENGSGSASNVAYLLGKFGMETYLGSVVGDDTFGQSIKKELESVGVHTEYMETAFEKRTNMSLTIISKEDKKKIVNNFNKEKMVLKKSEFQTPPDFIYIDGYDYGASLSALNKYSAVPSVMGATKCDKEIFELCKYCKYIIASKEFAEWVTSSKIDFNNPGSLVTVYSNLLNKLVKKEIIITLGEKGSLYIANNQIKVMPALKIDVLDQSGSGDFFRAAFIYALSQGYDIEKTVTFANIAGGLATGKVGTRASAPEISEIMQYFNQKYGEVAGTAEPAETKEAQTDEQNSNK